MSLRSLLRLACALALLAGGSACSRGVRITMTNESDGPVSLWVDAFESMGSDNEVQPSHSRHYTDKEGEVADEYAIGAGRDGQLLTTVLCSQGGDEAFDFLVTFEDDPDPHLSCVTED